jgi:hypothetical protein
VLFPPERSSDNGPALCFAPPGAVASAVANTPDAPQLADAAARGPGGGSGAEPGTATGAARPNAVAASATSGTASPHKGAPTAVTFELPAATQPAPVASQLRLAGSLQARIEQEKVGKNYEHYIFVCLQLQLSACDCPLHSKTRFWTVFWFLLH